MRITTTLIFLFLLVSTSLTSQRIMTPSQYMHNRFAINSAFGGSREVLSLFASFRKQWAGMPNSPVNQYFTGHTPLKNQKMALGFQIYNESYAIKNNFGASLSYTYRTRITPYTWMAFSVSGGISNYSANWSKVTTEHSNDDVFGGNETTLGPQAGFGWSIYNNHFFGGISIPEFFHHDFDQLNSTVFDPEKADYFLTSGYMFDLSPVVQFQPSVLLKINSTTETWSDFSGNFIYHDFIWAGVTYRTRDELIFLTGWQLLPQLRMAYSYDYSLGEIGNFHQGSHEISIQYDFGYQINTPSPKFF